jgi:hypothetical protein
VSRSGPGPPATDKPPVGAAVARIYVRRNADPAALQRIRRYLKSRARAHYAFAERGAWTTIDVQAPDDLELIRHEFYRLIDGWQDLS